MGAYGIFRFSLFKTKNSNLIWNIILGWRFINIGVLGLLIFRLKDLKILIAFSSINHMLLVMLGWYLFSKTNLIFCIILNLGHGLIRRGLFFSIGKLYENSHSRNVLLNRGINHINSIFSFVWFLFLIAKRSAPTSISLYREIGMISHFIFYFSLGGVCLFFFIILGGFYCIYLFVKNFHGNFLLFKNFITFEMVYQFVRVIHLVYIYFFIFFLKRFF
jgi:NADH:ubiquinone oxidoreductase subunit 4 (subunit M)